MKIDLTYEISKKQITSYLQGISDRDRALVSTGHFGTHFDVMGKTFALDYTESRGVIFDVIDVAEIAITDIDVDKIQAGDFVLLRTGVSEKYEYGSVDYNEKFPQLSWELIEALVDKDIRMIGIDMRGVRKGDEHAEADNFCAQRNVFVVENLVNLDKLLAYRDRDFVVHIYPLRLKGFSGIPARVVAEI